MEKWYKMNESILVIEDDKNIIDGLNDIFAMKGYEIQSAMSAKQTFQILSSCKIDLIILDVHLGMENGYELCKEIRKQFVIPILFLTACNSEMELVRGFQVGGDDYITKPFRVQELIVRVESLLKRRHAQINGKIKSGALTINSLQYNVMKSGEQLDLTLNEWKIIMLLIDNWPNVISRENLLYQIWDKHASYVEENTLNVNISRIREKLGVYQNKNYIETIRGVGYRWGIPVNH